MMPARIGVALLIALVSTAVSWVGLDIWTGQGGNPLPVPWVAVIGLVVVVVAVIVAGLPVRNWVHGARDRVLDPIVAARTAVLAKAAAYGGAVILGWYLSQAILIFPDLVGARKQRLIIALLASGTALALSIAGFVVQRWCRIPPGDDDPSGPTGSDFDSVR